MGGLSNRVHSNVRLQSSLSVLRYNLCVLSGEHENDRRRGRGGQIVPCKACLPNRGEPLLQPASLELLRLLCDLGYNVSLETGGSLDCTKVDPRVKKIIDVKTPDSGAADSFHLSNLPSNPDFSVVNTEFKFVICSEKDFFWAQNFAEQNQLFVRTEVLFSPAHQRVDAKWLASKILASKCPARLQTQLHKFIWSAHTRGV